MSRVDIELSKVEGKNRIGRENFRSVDRKIRKTKYVYLPGEEKNSQEETSGNHHEESNNIEVQKEKENETMTKTMKIEGMMCGHCEARVKKVLEKLEAVEFALVSHEKGTAVVTLTADISNEELKKVVEEQDYTVTDIQ